MPQPEEEETVSHSSHPWQSEIFPVSSPQYTDPHFDPTLFAPYGPYDINATNRWATAAAVITLFNMVIGTLSLLIVGPIIAIVLCVLGIVCGHIALFQMRRSAESGRARALVSLFLNYLGLVLLLGLVCMLLLINSIGHALLGL